VLCGGGGGWAALGRRRVAAVGNIGQWHGCAQVLDRSLLPLPDREGH
jgi:hypothetical protein